MNAPQGKISRPLVGALAALLLVAGAVAAIVPHESTSQWDLFQGACVRVGLVMTAWWLALPLLQRDGAAARALGGFFVILMLALVFLRRVPLKFIIPIALALVVLGLVLRPRPKRRPGSRP
jgi:hypothetical protein